MTRYDIIKDSAERFYSIDNIIRYIYIQYEIDKFKKEVIIYYSLYDFFIVIQNFNNWIFIKRINFKNVNCYNLYTLFVESIDFPYSDEELLKKMIRVICSLRVK